MIVARATAIVASIAVMTVAAPRTGARASAAYTGAATAAGAFAATAGATTAAGAFAAAAGAATATGVTAIAAPPIIIAWSRTVVIVRTPVPFSSCLGVSTTLTTTGLTAAVI